MAFLLIEVPYDTPYDVLQQMNELLNKAIPSDHHHLIYTGTIGDFGLKISVILNDNESIASIYDNVKESKEGMLDIIDPKPFDPELVIFPPTRRTFFDRLFKRNIGG